jgi:ABC-type amino acid transport substrate-binding protein
MKRALILLVAGLSLTFSVVAQANDPVLRVGIVVQSIPPQTYYENNDRTTPLLGYEVDVIREVARRLHMQAVFVDSEWSSLFTGLLAGKWDMASSDIFITKKRVAMMDFSTPWLDAGVSSLEKKGAKVDTLSDLKGKTLGCATGSGPAIWLNDNIAKYGPYTLKTYQAVADMFLDVENGRLNAAFTDDVAVDWYVKDHSATMQRGVSVGVAYKVGFAFRKGHPLVPKVTQALNDMKKDHFIMDVYKKYYGVYPLESSAANVIINNYAPTD